MIFCCAPMEGVTGRVFRRAHHDLFPGVDRYYTPFIALNQNFGSTSRSTRELDVNANEGIPVVPQVLASNAEDVLHAAPRIRDLGYTEINLNLGCPSATVVTKHKGAGLLADPDALDRLLDTLYSKLPLPLSLKTRIGMTDVSESERLFDIFSKYPVAGLTVHPRLRSELYRGAIHIDIFDAYAREMPFPVYYNGDLFTSDAARAVLAPRPWLSGAMFGRGLVANPALIRELKGGNRLNKRELRAFYDRLTEDFLIEMPGEKTVLFHIKELSLYMVSLFPDSAKHAKRIRKASTVADFNAAIDSLFSERELTADGAFDMDTTFPTH